MYGSKQTCPSKQAKASKLLDIYIRNNKKQALLVHSREVANLHHITTAISRRFHVPPESQILFHNGERISASSSEQLRVEDKAIIHLIDSRRITDNITINIRRLNLPRIEQYRIPSSQIIEDFIVRSIQDEEPHRLFFVQTGRQLNSKRSFAEEFVEDESELFCLHEEKDQVSEEKREKYEAKDKRKSEEKEKRKIESSEEIALAKRQNLKKVESVKEQSHALDNESEGEVMTPNFKKKKTGEYNFVNNDMFLHPGQSNQESNNSSSLITEQNPHLNRSHQTQNNFFNEGSSISEIVNESLHNPQNKRGGEENSIMFQSAIMGLNNEGSMINPHLHSRINNHIEENSLDKQPSEDGSFSVSFDTRAPEMLPVDRQLTALDREEIVEVDQSKQDTFSQQIDTKEQNSGDGNEKIQKSRGENEELSQFSLETVENHKLTDSCEMRALKKQTSGKSKKNESIILIDEPSHNSHIEVESENTDNKVEKSQNKQNSCKSKGEKNELDNSGGKISSSLREQGPKQVDLFIIQNQNGNENMCSDILQKEEVETNGRGSSSNFYSRNSSRVRDNEYGFGYFNKANNPNRFSDYREYNNRESELDLDISKSQHNQPYQDFIQSIKRQYEVEPQKQCQLKTKQPEKVEDKEESFQAFEAPSEAKFYYGPSSLQGPGKSEHTESNLLFNNDYESHEADKQSSKIDELNLLCSQIYHNANSNRNESAAAVLKEILKQASQKERSSIKREESSETSINRNMNQVKRTQSYDHSLSLKNHLEGFESLQKMQLRSSANPFQQIVNFQSEKQYKTVVLTWSYTLNDLMYECQFPEEDPLLAYLSNIQNQCIQPLT